jgi:hypothetical protein
MTARDAMKQATKEPRYSDDPFLNELSEKLIFVARIAVDNEKHIQQDHERLCKLIEGVHSMMDEHARTLKRVVDMEKVVSVLQGERSSLVGDLLARRGEN